MVNSITKIFQVFITANTRSQEAFLSVDLNALANNETVANHFL